jgi:hypothetical protein
MNFKKSTIPSDVQENEEIEEVIAKTIPSDVEENEENEEVIVGTIPCPMNEMEEKTDRAISAKEPIVYQQRRFRGQGEHVKQPRS